MKRAKTIRFCAVSGNGRVGSALLVAILVMGILLTLTLGLSALVIREITQTGDVVAAGKAYFAAEAGVENALLDLRMHLPGYQTLSKDNVGGYVKKEDENLSFQYRIRNQGNAYPYFDVDQPIFLTPGVGITKDALEEQHPKQTYNILPLNGTVTIPLFVDCGDGTYKDVKNFVLQYFVEFDTDPEIDMTEFQGKTLELKDFDVLRWKLFGVSSINNDPKKASRTEAISDFYPAHENDGPAQPVCIGSDLNLALTNQCTNIPVAKFVDVEPGTKVDLDSVDLIQNAWGVARECYASDAGFAIGNEFGESGIRANCNIKTFMDNHTKNYLTITNVVNPDIVGITDPVKRYARANIYYKIIAEKDANEVCANDSQDGANVMVREYADISADGFVSGGKVKQSIDVKMKLNSFLPVFNFSLYRTDPGNPDPEESAV